MRLLVTNHAAERGWSRLRLTPAQILKDAEDHFHRALPAKRDPAERFIIGSLARYPVAKNGSILTLITF